MPPLLFATTNPGKIREVRHLLVSWPNLRTLQDLPPIEEPEETGATFHENAVLKAAYYGRASGMVTVAEDSGLVIDALNGAPGVHSARYPGATYPEKFANLYAALAGHPRPWIARYVCAVAVVEPQAGRLLFTTDGIVDGEIWPTPRGDQGFGYDPIFYYPPFARTFGEVSDADKLTVAHRGRAFRQVEEWLRTTPSALLR